MEGSPFFASLAQLVEHVICNLGVVGSSPTRGSKKGLYRPIIVKKTSKLLLVAICSFFCAIGFVHTVALGFCCRDLLCRSQEIEKHLFQDPRSIIRE